jgi:hypothetical protein
MCISARLPCGNAGSSHFRSLRHGASALTRRPTSLAQPGRPLCLELKGSRSQRANARSGVEGQRSGPSSNLSVIPQLQVLHALLAHVAERHRRAGWVFLVWNHELAPVRIRYVSRGRRYHYFIRLWFL